MEPQASAPIWMQLPPPWRCPFKLDALYGCLFSTCTYVGLLHVFGHGPRNHVATIRKRIIASLAACCVSWIPVGMEVFGPHREGTRAELAECLGLLPPAPIRAVLYPLLITATLFACPLALRVQTKGSLLSPGMRSWAQAVALAARAGDMRALWHALSLSFAAHNLWLWRNLVVAPLSEEWVFRACMAPVLLNQGWSELNTVMVTPLFFGAAHLHHLHDLIVHQRVRVKQAVVTVCVQFAYTLVFGWYATWLFIATRSLAAIVIVHAFCNWMGFPDFRRMVQAWGPTDLKLGLITSGCIFIGLMFWVEAACT